MTARGLTSDEERQKGTRAGRYGLQIKSLIFFILNLILMDFFSNKRQSDHFKYVVFISNKHEFPYLE